MLKNKKKLAVFLAILIVVFCFERENKMNFFEKSHPKRYKNFGDFKLKTNIKHSLKIGLYINIIYQIIIIFYILQICGDIEKNPGPELKKVIYFEEMDLEKNRNEVKFLYMNCRSINNKHDEMSDFLQKLDSLTFLVVTETWIKEDTEIPTNFLTNTHDFLHQPRSKMTQLNRGGGVGIWIPKQFAYKIRKDISTINRNFFESLWIEIDKPFREKLFVNVAYCSNRQLGDFFLDELTSEISASYQFTDNVIIFGDYNINFNDRKDEDMLQDFAANNALNLVNTCHPTWTNGSKTTLIDHCLTSKNQIYNTIPVEPLFKSDHFTLIYFSSIEIEDEMQNENIEYRDTRSFSRSNFNRDLALLDWSPIYRQNNAEKMFDKFCLLFEEVLNKNCPIKTKILKPRKREEKKWLTKELKNMINEKHQTFNRWKESQSIECYNNYKKVRNKVNRELKSAADSYAQSMFEDLPDSKQNGNL